MERWHNKIAVVTGASTGIGATVVKDLIKAGIIVAGLARRTEKIEEIRELLPTELQTNLHVVKCDVSSEESINEAFEWIVKNLGGVDILINCAGIVIAGRISDTSNEQLQQVIQTNFMGTVFCTKKAFESMKQRGGLGHIINVNSMAGIRILQTMGRINMYCPSKFAMTAVTEVFRQEFHQLKTKVKITSICPGPVKTDILYDKALQYVGEDILQSEDVAQCIMFALSTPAHVQIHELTIRSIGEKLN